MTHGRSAAPVPVGSGPRRYALHKSSPATTQVGGYGYLAAVKKLWELSGLSETAGSLQASDIALRDLYKLTNAERAAMIREITDLLETTSHTADKAGTMAWSASGLRNLLRAVTQEKLTPVGKLLSRLLEKDRSWAEIVKKYGDPFDAALTSEKRMEIADEIIEKTASTSKAMNRLQVVGKGLMVLNVAISAFQIGAGINKIRSGKVGEGTVDIAEGTTNVSLTIGTYAGMKSGAIVIAEGTGLATAVTGLAAGGSLAFAFEETRRTMRGQKTMAAEARDFWKSVQDDAVEEGATVTGALKYVGAEFGKGIAGCLASGQKDLWGLLD
jgi:hypothetical protein